MRRLIYSKAVDKSTLWDGFTIKSALLDNVLGATGKLAIGQSREIKLLLGDRIYEGIKLGNRKFDRERYPNHQEMYQVRYSQNSEFSKALRQLYSDVWNYIAIKQIEYKEAGQRKFVEIPENLQRQIAFFATENDNVWEVETFTTQDYSSMRDFIQTNNLSENDVENLLLTDSNSRISEVAGVKKIRVLDRKVGESLKVLYNYKCQVCGCEIGAVYDAEKHVIEAHHILPFAESINNNFDNIMILCPNHHRAIHAFHGEFHRRDASILYPNGYKESLQLNFHL